jgi:hypothetical protein
MNQPQSLNRLAYVWGDPVNSNDPSGLCIINGQVYPDPCFSVTGTVNGGSGGSGGSGGGGGAIVITPLLPPPDDPPPVIPPNRDKLQAQCLSSFYNSPLGATVKFFSLIDLITDFGNAWPDWTVLPAVKAGTIAVLQSLSNTVGSTDFLSVAGSSASTTILGEFAALIGAVEAASGPGLLAIPLATAVDAGVRQMCSQVPGLKF